MASELSILRRSACTKGLKIANAVAEYIRRWKNCDTHTSKEEIEKVSLDYSDMLTANGYTTEWKKKVILKALTGYQWILKMIDRGEMSRNRLGKETKMRRREKRLT